MGASFLKQKIRSLFRVKKEKSYDHGNFFVQSLIILPTDVVHRSMPCCQSSEGVQQALLTLHSYWYIFHDHSTPFFKIKWRLYFLFEKWDLHFLKKAAVIWSRKTNFLGIQKIKYGNVSNCFARCSKYTSRTEQTHALIVLYCQFLKKISSHTIMRNIY